MSLSKVKNKLSNVFQLLERTDLSATGEADNSIAEQVDLDLATIYPHAQEDIVTPHIAYLYNTRIGWVQIVESPSSIASTTPVNVMYKGGRKFGIYNLENCNRTNGLITCEQFIADVSLTAAGHNYKFNNMKKLYNFGRVAEGNGYEIFNTNIVSNLGGSVNNGFNLNKTFLKQTLASAIYINKDSVLHSSIDNIIVKINPLRTINSNTNQVIGSSNEYINMTGVMTVLIYSDKLVYIRHDGLNFTYKIYSYPNLSLIKTGTETSLRDIYIKNNITRQGLIGPIGSNYQANDGEHLPIFAPTGFVINIVRNYISGRYETDAIQIIDLYNIVGPMVAVTDDLTHTAYGNNLYVYYL